MNKDIFYITDGKTQCKLLSENGKFEIIRDKSASIEQTSAETKLFNDFVAAPQNDNDYNLNGSTISMFKGNNSCIFASPAHFSSDEMKQLRNYNESNFTNVTRTIPGNGELEVVSSCTTFWLYSPTASQQDQAENKYDKAPSHFIPITATDNKFDLHTIPEDLQGSLSQITPEELQKQQDLENNKGNPFMSISGKNKYLLIHPDKIYNEWGEPAQLGKLGMQLLSWQPSNLPKVKIPQTNTTQYNNPVSHGKTPLEL